MAGYDDDLLGARRRILARALSHTGVRAALDKVRAPPAGGSIAGFLGLGGDGRHTAVPTFASDLAKAFHEAQVQRHEADYDLDKPFMEKDARLLCDRIETVIAEWRAATSAADRDLKSALCVLVLLRGRLRAEG